MFDNSNEIQSSKIHFIDGEQIEIYFPEEQLEYKLSICSKGVANCDDHIVVELPEMFKSTFYKGEDFVKCRYVYNNIVYEFGGEIIRLVHEKNSYVVISKPSNLRMGNSRQKDRVSTKILCEYSITQVAPGLQYTRDRGFATIKDASIGGVSFLTTDFIPINTVVRMLLLKTDISILVEIKKHQIVNEKNFYGGRIVSFENSSDAEYLSYIKNHIESKTENELLYNIY